MMKTIQNWIAGLLGDIADALYAASDKMFDSEYEDRKYERKLLSGRIPRYLEWEDEFGAISVQDLLTGEMLPPQSLH